MIRFFWLSLCVFILSGAVAQHPNQWIDFQQDYFRIPTARDGIYRLTSTQLIENGFPAGSIDPARIRIIHRGVEQAIFVAGESDGTFDTDDYIEFFGVKNDAGSDARLYRPEAVQHNPYHAVFSDTTSYFLTVGPGLGKRMIHVNSYNDAALPVAFHIDEKRLVFGDQYAYGASDRDEVYSSAFETGEGWTGTAIRQGQSRDFQLQGITRTVAAGAVPKLELMLVGRNSVAHTAEIRIGVSQRLVQVTLEPFEPTLIKQDIEWSDLTGDGKLTVRVSVPNRGYNDQVSVSYIRFRYPQAADALNLSEKLFEIPPGQPLVNLKVENAQAGSRFFDVTNPADTRRFGSVEDATLNATLTGAERGLRIFISSVWNIPAKITRVRFKEIDPALYNYVIITHPLLRKPAGGYSDPVAAYAEYRASDPGGAYKPLIVDVGEVFDQFNYGEKSPLAVYNFLAFLSASNTPSYLFLIGKGLEYHQKYYRTANSGTWAQQDLVPTGGAPGSDAIFSMHLEGGIPTGRLPAMSPVHVSAYLNKIKEMESAPFSELWRKKILHLSGGIEEWEPALFKQFLEDFQRIAEGPFLGGQVEAIAKQSRDVQTINIADQVNSGLGLITFFGHSSTSTLDFDIGNVTNKIMGYSNKGKYPMLLMNGCEVGAFFLRTKLFGEDWILAEDLGASAFIGHNAYASVNTLYRYSRSFYEVAYADSLMINQGIGDIQRETGQRFLDESDPTISNRSQVEQMILLGDPAARLFGASKPDFEVRETQVNIEGFNNEPVTVSSDSFAVKFVVRNFGRADRRPFRVEVRRTYSDNSFQVYDSIYSTPLNTDTLYLIIRNNEESRSGNNHFQITVDADHIIDELNESNNSAEINLLIPGNGTRHLYPVNFAIVHEKSIRLSFQATDVFSGERNFLLELDTVSTFDSPLKSAHHLTGEVLMAHPIELLTKDSLAYYWRTRLENPEEGEDSQWTVSSFTFIEGSRDGWAQVHFPQFLDNTTKGVELLESSRRLTFLKSQTPVEIRTFGASSGKPRDSVSVRIAGQEYNLYTQGFGCRLNTINLIAFDRSSTNPYIGVYMKWYEILYDYNGRRLLCGREPFVINSFAHNEVATGKNDLIAYVNNVAEGDSVVLYTMGNANFHLWPVSAKEKLGELGVSLEQFSQFVSGEPVIILGKKGSDPGTAKVFRNTDGNPLTSRLYVSKTITGGFDKGNMTSPLIGPAYQWDELTFSVNEVEPSDNIRFEVRGVRMNREEVTIIDEASLPVSLAGIDATEFPYLRVVFHTSDETLLTSGQLTNWIVLYTPVPEGILIPEDRGKEASTLQEGDLYRQRFSFINASEHEFRDSLTVQSSLSNKITGVGDLVVAKIAKPAPRDTTQFELVRNTTGFAGWNDLHVFVNPRVLPEQYYDNNLVLLKNAAHVTIDKTAPVTEVTFDGKFIENGDFVSPRPRIRVSIIDENPFIFRTDTTGIRMFLTSPCENDACEPEYISFSRPDVTWTALVSDRKFTIDFMPNLADGTYTLSVEVSDAAGNKPSLPYEVRFVVSGSTMISIDPPHPNPMTLSTEFTYAISGSDVPSKVRLEILDLSGRLVYSHQQTNGLTVGRNSFLWEGSDQMGTALPNGLYVFRFKIFAGSVTKEAKGKLVIRR